MKATISMTVVTARFFQITSSLALIALIGCASRGYERAAATGSGIDELKTELTTAKKELDATVGALEEVVSAEDPSAPYEEFVRAIADMEGQADTIRAQADSVRSAGDTYFSEWEARLASIKSEELRAKSEKRRTDLAASYDEMKAASETTKEAYQPLMAALNDIKEYLGLDLSATSVAGIGDQVTKARDDAGKVQESIDGLLGTLDELASQLATGMPAEDAAPAPSE